MSSFAPVAIFCFNRLEHLKKTVESLKKNALASETDVIFFSDGARSDSEQAVVNEVRSYLQRVDGFQSVKLVFRNENLGLATSVIDGVSSIVNQFGKVIVLEDDLETSPYFLSYMNDALNLYEEKPEVCSIHGYVYPLKEKLSTDYFFLKGADCWGWATWKDSWEEFEADGDKLLQEILVRPDKDLFDFNGNGGYIEMLKKQVRGENSSWAIRWYASAFLKERLTLYPSQTFVKNIGLDSSGTHCSSESEAFFSEISMTYPAIDKAQLISENGEARLAFNEYFKGKRLSLWTRVINRLKGRFL